MSSKPMFTPEELEENLLNDETLRLSLHKEIMNDSEEIWFEIYKSITSHIEKID
jgi:hypothetical protein